MIVVVIIVIIIIFIVVIVILASAVRRFDAVLDGRLHPLVDFPSVGDVFANIFQVGLQPIVNIKRVFESL